MNQRKWDVIIVGAGLTGLIAARKLQAAGKSVLVIEKSAKVGGRMTSEKLEGCIVDAGFQVVLPGYPSFRHLDFLPDLDLGYFRRGAVVVDGDIRRVIADPVHEPLLFLRSLAKGLPLSLGDCVAIWSALFHPDRSTGTLLNNKSGRAAPFKDFLRSFLLGVFLDPSLSSPAKLSSFYLSTFFRGGAALPRQGIGAFTNRLAEGVDVLFESPVIEFGNNRVRTEKQEFLADFVLVTAPEIQPEKAKGWSGTTCFNFLSSRQIELNRLLVLDLNAQTGDVNNVANLTEISPEYSPPGTSLLSASTIGISHLTEGEAATQTARLVQAALTDLRLIKRVDIPFALPNFNDFGKGENPAGSGHCVVSGIHYASDVQLYGSQNAAIIVGVAAAKSIISLA